MYVEDKVTSSIIINTYTCQLLGFLILLVSESLQALVLLIASSIHVAKATAFLATRLVTLPAIGCSWKCSEAVGRLLLHVQLSSWDILFVDQWQTYIHDLGIQSYFLRQNHISFCFREAKDSNLIRFGLLLYFFYQKTVMKTKDTEVCWWIQQSQMMANNVNAR